MTLDGRPWYYSNIPWPTRYSNRQRLGVRGTRSGPSLTGGSPRSWEKGVSIVVWKTYLVVANCSAHFLPHRSSYLGLLEVRPIALGPVTKSDNADTRSGQYTSRSDQRRWLCAAKVDRVVHSGFWEVQVHGVGPVKRKRENPFRGGGVRKKGNNQEQHLFECVGKSGPVL